MSDPFNLRRFVHEQEPVYERVRRELRAGRKESHWMWFVFPQIAGLGQGSTSIRFAIASLEEAGAYLPIRSSGPDYGNARSSLLRSREEAPAKSSGRSTR